jgi:hypothetical protein
MNGFPQISTRNISKYYIARKIAKSFSLADVLEWLLAVHTDKGVGGCPVLDALSRTGFFFNSLARDLKRRLTHLLALNFRVPQPFTIL